MSKTIEEYIQFAIDNGYDIDPYSYEKGVSIGDQYLSGEYFVQRWEDKVYSILSIEGFITSKEFIEAIARGYVKNNEPTKYGEVEGIGKYKSENGILFLYDEIIEQLTTEQAIAIRKNDLEEFINNLLNNAG